MSQTLTVADARTLEAFLLGNESIPDAMSLAELHGYLCGLLCCQDSPEPDSWLRWVWDAERGVAEPDFASLEAAQAVVSLIMRLKNDSEDLLASNPDEFQPFFDEDEPVGEQTEGRENYSDWCAGFLTAVEHYPKGWKKLLQETPESIVAIQLYGTVEGLEQLAEMNYDETAYEQHREVIAYSTVELYQKALFLKGLAVKKTPLVNSAKIGRNEVCHCGSGKKYKLCHGKN
jgi:uncharacterized protein